MKFFALILSLFLFLNNCKSNEQIIKYNPTPTVGCSMIIDSKERLLCISKMIKQLEDIKNSKIIIVDKKENKRVDEIYVSYTITYCFTDKEEKERYLCFDSLRDEYNPTFLGIVIDYSKKVGFGFLIGAIVGVTYSP